jgi:hypothetical protein
MSKHSLLLLVLGWLVLRPKPAAQPPKRSTKPRAFQ